MKQPDTEQLDDSPDISAMAATLGVEAQGQAGSPHPRIVRPNMEAMVLVVA